MKKVGKLVEEKINLRKAAEEKLAKRQDENVAKLTESEVLKLIHELEVHQIELEMQNEELKLAKENAERATEELTELYDFAPVGYFTFSPDGTIEKLNLYGANLLDTTRSNLLKRNFISFVSVNSQQTFNDFLKEVFDSGLTRNCEIRLNVPQNPELYVFISGIRSEDRTLCFANITDISRLKKTEEELKTNYALLKIAGRTAKFGGWIHDLANNKGFWSEEVSNIHETPIGYVPDLKDGINFYAPEWRETITTAAIECATNGTPYDLELELITAKNNRIWIRTLGEAVRNQRGEITNIRGSIQDISQHKKAEEELRAVQEKYRIVADNTYDWEFWEGPEGQYLYHSPSCKRITGFDAADFISDKKMLLKIIHPEDLDLYDQHSRLSKTELKPSSVEFRIINADNTTIWIEQMCQPVYSAEGTFLGVRGSNRDITRRKLHYSINVSRLNLVQYAQTHTLDELLEETLNEAEKLTGSQIGFFHFVDINQEDLKLENWSTKTKAIFCKAEEIDTHYPISKAGVWVDCLKERKPVIHNDYASLAHRKGMPEGHAEVIRELVVPIFRGDKIKGIIGVGNKATNYIQQDIDAISTLADQAWEITELKKAEGELIESEAQLRELNATKDKFFSIIAHDLKNPFNAIMGFSNLLEDHILEKDYERIDKYVTHIKGATQTALDLLGNLLEWTRSQTGRMEFNPDFVEMVGLINEIVNFVNPSAAQKSIQITRKLPGVAPALVDREMISTVLRNLLSNAVKFTRIGGEIVISIEQVGKELLVTVADNGVGINKEAKNKLFRIDQSYSTKGTNHETGTGLGLILCKEFVEKHGGKIWVESEVNKGSFFYFTLPLKNQNT